MILCFSGTGNSRYTAEYLGLKLGDEVQFINAFLKSGKDGDFRSEKPYVFVCPTYAWRMPHVVRDFILRSRFTGCADAYFVLTYGTSVGSAGQDAEALCRRKEFAFRGFASVRMPENYLVLFDVPSPEKASAMVRGAGKKLDTLAPLIARRQPFSSCRGPLAARVFGGAVNSLLYQLFVKADGFYAADSCIGCGQCVALCPLNNIQMNGNRPQWGKNCTHCMACIGGCPAAAVEYKRRTQGKRRYFLTERPGGVLRCSKQ